LPDRQWYRWRPSCRPYFLTEKLPQNGQLFARHINNHGLLLTLAEKQEKHQLKMSIISIHQTDPPVAIH